MEMKHSLHLQQKQSLIMTPRLQQALKLLQVPTLELQQILKQEVLQNPLLEEVDDLAEQEDIERENSADEQNNEEAEEPGEEDAIDWSEYMQDGLDRTYVPQSETSIEFLEKVPVTRVTLAESLLEQLHFLNLPAEQMTIAEFLVGSSTSAAGWSRRWPTSSRPSAGRRTRSSACSPSFRRSSRSGSAPATCASAC